MSNLQQRPLNQHRALGLLEAIANQAYVCPGWRCGQVVWNATHLRFPTLTEPLRGTEADPFNDDSAVPVFLAFILMMLETYEVPEPTIKIN